MMVSLAEHDVCAWFRQLPSYRRLETLCQMLNLCVPLEIRFVETYLTKLASREVLYLKDHENRANNHTDLKRLVEQGGSPLDGPTRSRFVISLALLKSDNTSAAEILYPALSNGLPADRASLAVQEPKCLEELILLYSMAALHCAFTFSQQTALERLKSELVKLGQPSSASPTCAGLSCASTSTANAAGLNAIPVSLAQAGNVGMACPPGQPVYSYPHPLSIVSSVLPPQFQWCNPPPQNVQLPAMIQPAGSLHPAVTFAPSVSSVPNPKLSQVVVKAGRGAPQKLSLYGTFADGRQVHVVRDYGQIAELRNRLSGPYNSLPSLSMLYNNNSELVHKEIKEFFEQICANFADLDLVCSFFDQHPVQHPQPQTAQIITNSSIPRFTLTPPPSHQFPYARDLAATDQGILDVQNALKTAHVSKHIQKFKDVTNMNDFCELTEESLRARGLSSQAVDRIQQVQALNAVSSAQQQQQQQQHCQPASSPHSQGNQGAAAANSGQWHSSEEDTTPPSSSPSPPSHQQFTSPPPQFYSIMMPIQPGSATAYVPTSYPGYHLSTFVAAGPPQQNGTYVTTQGVPTNGQHLVHPMLVHTQHNPSATGYSGGVSPLANASGPMNHLHAHNGQSGAVPTTAALSHLHHPPSATGSVSQHSPTGQGGGLSHTKAEAQAPGSAPVQSHVKRQPLRSQH